MASYISHAIMGEELYNSLTSENLLKESIDVSKVRSYSIAHDYAYLVGDLDNHNSKTKAYILYMVRYVKRNHLETNSEVIACLYSHIAHFCLDSFIHQWIEWLAWGCKKVGIISSHLRIECLLDDFFSREILRKNPKDIDFRYFNKGDFSNINIKQLLGEAYKTIYGKKDVLSSCRLIRDFFSLLEIIHKKLIFSSWEQFLDYKVFMNTNQLTWEEITNANHAPWQNPFSGEVHEESALDLFHKSIDEALSLINDINKYLYGNETFSKIERCIPNVSLDTGVRPVKNPQVLYKRSKLGI